IVSVFLATLFLFAWQSEFKRQLWPRWAIMGVLGGQLLLVASYNVAYLLLPLLSLGVKIGKKGLDWESARSFLIYCGAGFLTFMPQFFVWWLFFGSPLATPYGAQLSWLDSQFWLAWFSTWHGLFVFAPILLFSLIGFGFLFKKNRILSIGLAIIFLLFSYIIGTNAAWWGGTSFGPRYFISLTPIFALGLALFLDRFSNLVRYGFVIIFTGWTVLLYAQTALGFMNLHNWYPWRTLLQGQWQALTQFFVVIRDSQLPATSGELLGVVIGLALLGGLMFAGLIWLVESPSMLPTQYFAYLLLGFVTINLLFVVYGGRNSQAAQQELVAQGYYEEKAQIYRHDPFDAMKNYNKLAGFYRVKEQPEQALAIMEAAISLWPNKTRLILDTLPTQGNQPVYHPLDFNFSNVTRLRGYTLSKSAEAPHTLTIVLDWERLAGEADEINYTLLIKDWVSQETITQYRLEEGFIGVSNVGVYPLDEIPDGMYFRDTLTLPYTPDNRFGAISLIVDGLAIFPYTVDSQPSEAVQLGFIDLSQDGLLTPVTYSFENKIALTGYQTYYDIQQQQLLVAFQWQSLNPLADDYKIFNHVLNSDQTVVAQRDIDPLSGLKPTSQWQQGESFLDLYEIPLQADIYNEVNQLNIGFYRLDTGGRLLLFDSSGSSAVGDSIQLDLK
ncbi:MAG: hypothetical protein AAF485_23580, partial [Chloroflexota bacterium]